MNAWLMLLIVAIGAFIAMLFREQQKLKPQRPSSSRPPPMPESFDSPPNSEDVPPPLPAGPRTVTPANRPMPPLRFRRTVPPPLPAQVPAVVPVVTPAPMLEPPRRAPTVSAPSRPPSPAVKQLLELLRTPQTVRAAILLNEVLGPPRSKRPHR